MKPTRPVQLLTWQLHFPAVEETIHLELVLDGIGAEVIEAAVDNDIFARVLPAYVLRRRRSHLAPDAALWLSARGKEHFRCRLNLGQQVFSYASELSELAEDLLKIVLQILAIKGARCGRALFHASALGTSQGAVLVPGPSGTGKSTTALWWLRSGRSLLASETAVVGREGIHGGNPVLSIKRGAFDYHLGGVSSRPSRVNGEYLLFEASPPQSIAAPVASVVFVKLTRPGDGINIVPVSRRLATMKLYEAAHWQAVGGFLIGGMTLSLPPAADRRALDGIARIVKLLAKRELYALEGGVDAIGEWLAARFGTGTSS